MISVFMMSVRKRCNRQPVSTQRKSMRSTLSVNPWLYVEALLKCYNRREKRVRSICRSTPVCGLTWASRGNTKSQYPSGVVHTYIFARRTHGHRCAVNGRVRRYQICRTRPRLQWEQRRLRRWRRQNIRVGFTWFSRTTATSRVTDDAP